MSISGKSMFIKRQMKKEYVNFDISNKPKRQKVFLAEEASCSKTASCKNTNETSTATNTTNVFENANDQLINYVSESESSTILSSVSGTDADEFSQNQVNDNGCPNTNGRVNKEEKNLRSKLKNWAVDSHINHQQLNKLLAVLKEYHPELPSDSRTLLCTPRKCHSAIIAEANGFSKFYYFGISTSLFNQFKSDGLENLLKENNIKTIKLIFNVDGVPITKSTNSQFWPILGMISTDNLNCRICPFVVAIFYGNNKPCDLDVYWKQFVEEINLLINTGFTFKNILYEVQLLAIISDAPTRAYIKGIKGHSGFFGCERCFQKGIYINHKLVYPNEEHPRRTNNNFLNKTQPEHHLQTSPLTKIKDFGLITNVPLDYMHMVCLGVIRKLIGFWVKTTSCFRVTPHFRKVMSDRSLSLANSLPMEFQRKPRNFMELDRWKATEFRFFLLYSGPVILKDCIESSNYKHFLCLHVTMRILAKGDYNDSKRRMALNLIKKFMINFEKLYGSKELVYNVHSIKHLVEDILKKNITLDSISCFPFENALGHLVKLIRTPNKPLEQVICRLSECPNLFHPCLVKGTPLINKIKTDEKNCFVMIKPRNAIAKVVEIMDSKNLKVRIFNVQQNYFDKPIESNLVNVYRISSLGTYLFHVQTEDLVCKCWVFSNENETVAIGLLHLL
ncbi:hypothetical protein FQR65_LT17405 [Abscondita terminalis]|nr:hypothetical protein FQR65_LT17405 [Abscondita terminalis]